MTMQALEWALYEVPKKYPQITIGARLALIYVADFMTPVDPQKPSLDISISAVAKYMLVTNQEASEYVNELCQVINQVPNEFF